MSQDTTFVSRITTVVTTWAQAVNNFIFHGRNPIFVTSTGSANAYTITLPPTSLATAIAVGDSFEFLASFANTTTTPTVTIIGASNLGTFTIVDSGGDPLIADNIVAGGAYRLQYNGVAMQLQNPAPVAGGGGGGNVFLANNNPFDTGATAGQAIDIGFGAGWAANNVFLKSITATHAGTTQSPKGTLFITTGSGADGDPFTCDYAEMWGIRKRDYLTSNIAGDVNGPSALVLQGRRGDAGGAAFGVHKVFGTGTDTGGAVGVETTVQKLNTAGTVTMHVQSIQGFAEGAGGLTGTTGVGFDTEAQVGTIFSAFIANDLSPGSWTNILVASHSRSPGDIYFRLDNLGNLALFGGQIKFPAVQAASSNVNTLDDYEEGTFTPVFTCDTPGNLTIVYTTQAGFYTKIGRLVMAQFTIITSTFTHTTASGNVKITGLPFSSANLTGNFAAGSSQLSGLAASAYTDFNASIQPNTNYSQLLASAPAQATVPIQIAAFPTGGIAGAIAVEVTITYIAAT